MLMEILSHLLRAIISEKGDNTRDKAISVNKLPAYKENLSISSMC